jgi:hypothetical protein
MDDGRIKFFYKDYRDNEKRKVAEVPALEFIDRFLMHILPPRFRHVRQYGFLAPKGRETKLKAIREMLGCAEEDAEAFQQEREGNKETREIRGLCQASLEKEDDEHEVS